MGGYLHNATEGEDDQVHHAKEEAEVGDVIKDVIEGVAIHRCETGKHRHSNVLVAA